MADGVVPLERLLLRNEHWRSYYAINEMEIYGELLEYLQEKIDALETSQKEEKTALIYVQAVISSYAFEIAMKSLWALDFSDECVPRTYDLVAILDALKDETKRSLEGFHLTRQVLERMLTPFTSNRYSMEGVKERVIVYEAPGLRDLAQLLTEEIEENRKALLTSPNTFEI